MGEIKEIDEYRMYTGKSEIHKAINTLIGLIKGISIDNIINSAELDEIINWCNLYREFSTYSPFDEIFYILDMSLEDNNLTQEEIYDILWICRRIINQSEFKEYYDIITSSIQQLHGILHGLLSDGTLSAIEITNLQKWLNHHNFLKGTYPFDEIYSLVTTILDDGVVTDEEKNILIAFFGNFVDTKSSYNINEHDIKSLQEKYSINGICSTSPEIVFEDKTFCFTGTSLQATRKDFQQIILDKGGIFTNSVTQKTNYLIVGADGNPCWAFSCYGRKVEKTIELRKKGKAITIIHENDFWNAVNED